MSNETVVTGGGVEYQISALPMKYLKKIVALLSANKSGNFIENLEVWYPFIARAIQLGGKEDFKDETIDDWTMQEIANAWIKIQNLSGIKIGPKAVGEQKPAEENSTGTTSTAG